jgi:hypothetical protein
VRLRSLIVGGAILFAASGCAIFASDAPGRGEFSCIGVPQADCIRIVDNIRAGHPNVAVVGARVRCSQQTCTSASGQVNATVIFADGSVEQAGQAWAGGIAPPPVPQPSPSG